MNFERPAVINKRRRAIHACDYDHQINPFPKELRDYTYTVGTSAKSLDLRVFGESYLLTKELYIV